MKRLVLVLVLAAAGCTSDLHLVADFGASAYYHKGRYRAECVDVKGSAADCAALDALTMEASKEADLCNETQRRGKLPPSAKRKIKEYEKALERQPVAPVSVPAKTAVQESKPRYRLVDHDPGAAIDICNSAFGPLSSWCEEIK